MTHSISEVSSDFDKIKDIMNDLEDEQSNNNKNNLKLIIEHKSIDLSCILPKFNIGEIVYKKKKIVDRVKKTKGPTLF